MSPFRLCFAAFLCLASTAAHAAENNGSQPQVPNVIGLAYADAAKVLENSGMLIRRYTGDEGENVVFQLPLAGDTAATGDVVLVDTAKKSPAQAPKVVVPVAAPVVVPAETKTKAAAAGLATAIDITDLADGDYIVTKKAGNVLMRPLKLLRPDGTPNPTDPPAGGLTPFEQVIAGYTRTAILNRGGSKTTGAALSEIYSRVGAKVASGDIKPDNALPAVFAATNGLFADAGITDDEAWTGWRTNVGDGLDKLKQEGELSSAADYASALKQVSNGLNSVTGYTPQMQKLAAEAAAELADGRAAVANGILSGIDIDKIIKLIERIMKLLTLFGGLPG